MRVRFGRQGRRGAASTAVAALVLAAASGAGTAHAAEPQASIVMNTPDVAAGGSVTHTVRLHAEQKGLLSIFFGPAADERDPAQGELRISTTSAVGDATATCTHTTGIDAGGGIDCDVKAPGDISVSYTLKADASAFAWRLNAYGAFFIDGQYATTAESAFSVLSTRPVPDRHMFFARDAQGKLHTYEGGTGPSDPIGQLGVAGGGWQGYTALTRLSPTAMNAPGGAIVAQDAAGVLWYYSTSVSATHLNPADPFGARVRVGGGWNIYDRLIGVQDVTGDGKVDLTARDRAGVLWLYRGTGTTGAPFATRTRVGGGWNAYTLMTGPGDLTDDGLADLVARDTAGTLWFYRGTGKSTAPFAARTRVGGGWNTYNALI